MCISITDVSRCIANDTIHMKQLAMRYDTIHPYYNAVRFDAMKKNMIALFLYLRQTANHNLTYVSSDFWCLQACFIKQVYQIGQAYFS